MHIADDDLGILYLPRVLRLHEQAHGDFERGIAWLATIRIFVRLRIVVTVRVAVERKGISGVRCRRIHAHEAPDHRIVVTCIGIGEAAVLIVTFVPASTLPPAGSQDQSSTVIGRAPGPVPGRSQ
jgi:hypothetical protein